MASKRKRRNRKKRVDGFVVPKNFAGILIAVSVAALSYLWLCTCCDDLGSDIKELEKSLVQLENKFLNEEYKWMSMKSPQNLEDTLQQYSIKMTWPRRDQVVWLADARIQVDMDFDSVREHEPRMAQARGILRYD